MGGLVGGWVSSCLVGWVDGWVGGCLVGGRVGEVEKICLVPAGCDQQQTSLKEVQIVPVTPFLRCIAVGGCKASRIAKEDIGLNLLNSSCHQQACLLQSPFNHSCLGLQQNSNCMRST